MNRAAGAGLAICILRPRDDTETQRPGHPRRHGAGRFPDRGGAPAGELLHQHQGRGGRQTGLAAQPGTAGCFRGTAGADGPDLRRVVLPVRSQDPQLDHQRRLRPDGADRRGKVKDRPGDGETRKENSAGSVH